MIDLMKKLSKPFAGYVVGVELNVVDGYLDETAQRSSCNKPDCIIKDSIWIVPLRPELFIKVLFTGFELRK